MSFGPISDGSPGAFGALISTSGQRAIGTIFPDVAVREIHHDTMQITVHPVETGSPVTDHMFANPAIVELEYFWSNSTVQSVGYVQAVYAELLALQKSRQPLSISTGKRQYTSMGIASLAVITNDETENALAVRALAQEMIFTSVTTTAGSGTPNTNGSKAVGNIINPPSGDTLAAQTAASGGAEVDSNGFVSVPNAVAPGGFVSLQPVVASSFGQTQNSLLNVLPAP